MPQATPAREALEGDVQTGVLPATPAPTMARPVLNRLPQIAAYLLAMGQALLDVEIKGKAVRGLMLGMKVQPAGGSPTPSSALDARAGAIWQGNAPLWP